MADQVPRTENFKAFEALVAKTAGTYAFGDDTSVSGVGALLKVIGDMGLDPMNTEELRRGMERLFHIQFIGMPDLHSNRFILAPNHVSDADALILGLLHPPHSHCLQGRLDQQRGSASPLGQAL